VKNVLIIQQDDPYFLYETLKVLERFSAAFKDSTLTILVNPESLKALVQDFSPLIKGITTNVEEALKKSYEVSYNLSMSEFGWTTHSLVQSAKKIGPVLKGQELKIHGDWSSFLMTLKSNAPFLTFHLHDIYKNIFGIKSAELSERKNLLPQTLIFGLSNPDFFPPLEQEKLMQEIHARHPLLRIRDVSEVDLLEDHSATIYLGPASLNALKLTDSGARGIFITKNFQGFNLLPFSTGNFILSTRGQKLSAQTVLGFVDEFIGHKKHEYKPELSYYEIVHDPLFGAYFSALNDSDESYPLYQAHVVLWNFLLNLFEVNLNSQKPSPLQKDLLQANLDVLSKLARLHEYALTSINTILQESKSENAHAEVVEGHLKNLRDIGETDAKIANSHVFIRPILDFYHMKKGLDDGETLKARAQDALLSYSEEHQALKAFEELVTHFIELK
jgi:hypothetical protein